MSSELKQLRGQVRQVAKEMLPEILESELYARIEKKLMEVIIKRLDAIDERQKEITSYMIRSQNQPIVK